MMYFYMLAGINLNSYGLMIFELQIFVHASKAWFVSGASSLMHFVYDARLNMYNSEQNGLELL